MSGSDTKAVDGKYTMRWNTPYAQYLWNGDVMYGNPTERRYGPKKISFFDAVHGLEAEIEKMNTGEEA